MITDNLILIDELCVHHHIEMSFFTSLHDIGRIDIISIEQSSYIPQDKIADIEKMIRLHQELNINIEGIDIVFNLLEKIGSLEDEVISLKSRLQLLENHI